MSMRSFLGTIIIGCLVGLAFVEMSRAQSTPIPTTETVTPLINCRDEVFPYLFCKPVAAGHPQATMVKCVNNPNLPDLKDGLDILTPCKAFIPSSICSFSTVAKAAQSAFTAPVPWTTRPSSSNAGGYAQWETDRHNTFDVAPNIPLEPTKPDPNNYVGGESNQQYKDDLAFWNDEENQYNIDLDRYYQCMNAWDLVWHQNDAEADANDAMADWLSSCPGLHGTDPTCCLKINMDGNAKDWVGSYEPNSKTQYLAWTNYAQCGETSCSTTREVKVNICDKLLYRTDFPTGSDPAYLLCSPAKLTWYTGKTCPAVYTAGGYNVLSFRQLMQHEIGHFFGMLHIDTLGCAVWNADKGSVTLAKQILLTKPPKFPNGITDEDHCMFAKLYCPTPLNDVKDAHPFPTKFTADIYPNPTIGNCHVAYSVDERAFVRISIYDLLGKSLITAFADFQDPGSFTIPLYTKGLPSGSYVCRIEAGNRVLGMTFIVRH